MATVNHYFQSGRSIGRASEQNIYEDLIIESMKIYGFEVYYIPRTPSNYDNVLTEDPTSKFDHAYPIEMYLQSNNGFEGDSELLTKFGVEIRDSATFVVSRKRWSDVIGSTGNSVLTRPAEGDVIYFPLTKGFFEIRKVEHAVPFYQVGKLYVYTLYGELMQYSNERFNTGVAEIDQLVSGYDLGIDEFEIISESGDSILLETLESTPITSETYTSNRPGIGADNEKIRAEKNAVLDFSERNPFGDP